MRSFFGSSQLRVATLRGVPATGKPRRLRLIVGIEKLTKIQFLVNRSILLVCIRFVITLRVLFVCFSTV